MSTTIRYQAPAFELKLNTKNPELILKCRLEAAINEALLKEFKLILEGATIKCAGTTTYPDDSE